MYTKYYLIILVSVVYVLKLQAQTEVNLRYTIPDQVASGSEFTIHISIEKGNLQGISRIQVELPNGFEVAERRSANGEFRFANQTVIIQWLKLPVDETIDISFLVRVNQSMEGFFVVKGAFSYVEGNDWFKKEIYPHIITIKPESNVTEFIIPKNDQLDVTGVVKDEISCIRQKPFLNENNEIIVNLLITKSNLSKFGKIQEQVPVGYKAVSLISKNSIFVFNQNTRTVKFMWMNLPMETQYKVAYKLIPVHDITNDAFIITGKFTYAEHNTTKEVEIVERNMPF